jgi:hypothetical protein
VPITRPISEGITHASQESSPGKREELQSLLATPAGRKELQELEARYHAANGRLKPTSTSIITYLLVHEREQGLICD